MASDNNFGDGGRLVSRGLSGRSYWCPSLCGAARTPAPFDAGGHVAELLVRCVRRIGDRSVTQDQNARRGAPRFKSATGKQLLERLARRQPPGHWSRASARHEVAGEEDAHLGLCGQGHQGLVQGAGGDRDGNGRFGWLGLDLTDRGAGCQGRHRATQDQIAAEVPHRNTPWAPRGSPEWRTLIIGAGG